MKNEIKKTNYKLSNTTNRDVVEKSNNNWQIKILGLVTSRLTNIRESWDIDDIHKNNILSEK